MVRLKSTDYLVNTLSDAKQKANVERHFYPKVIITKYLGKKYPYAVGKYIVSVRGKYKHPITRKIKILGKVIVIK